MPLAGESALETYTMLAASGKQCQAVPKEWTLLQKEMFNKHYGDSQIEVWRYNPLLLAKNNLVDPLSLYLSMQSNDDERIIIELNKLINNIKWLED